MKLLPTMSMANLLYCEACMHALNHHFEGLLVDLRNPSDYDSFGRYDLSSLNGEIRPSLTKLKSLKYLDLSFNTFDGSIPDFLSSLENLQYLNLSKAGFSGAIPPNLGNLSSLQFLDISSDFQDLTADNIDRVTGLITLKHLAMDQVDFSTVGIGWVETLNKLPFLTELHLSFCSYPVSPILSLLLILLHFQS
ncbi:hypothetical protein GH714_029840 [Hevea brasiliensis]|uniref:Leucine-rich repeat-containing N-terminal plant-type domain-containing protein n=1 Tax=Hevea brasiliensis TaxID=3981 RepID=A0A6A6N7V7_HEVBR|nr:hypothetical protein GH714_029840 [Hevea brasiliensis]